MGGLFRLRLVDTIGRKMSEHSNPSTKRLKSMLKMLLEHGVSRYKDSSIEIEFSGMPPVMPQVREEEDKPFDMERYDQELSSPKKQKSQQRVDDLGNTDEDYLYWSANSQ